MTAVQILGFAGALTTAGLIGLIRCLLPARPDPVAALERLSTNPTPPPADRTGDSRGYDLMGHWALRRLPQAWTRVSAADLAVTETTATRFLGEKVASSMLGLMLAPLLGWGLLVWGLEISPPVAVPVGVSLAGAVALWFVPNLKLRRDAAERREELGRAVSAYCELVAMERQVGSGPRQALQFAATIGNTTVFTEIRRELDRSGWDGQQPWQALHTVANRLGLPALADVADAIRLGGEEGSQISGPLRARAASLRTQARTNAQAKANSTSEKLDLPGLVIGMVLSIILLGPPLAALLGP